MYITVLCKVVDNFGDIGVAWRLCRRLAKIQSKYKICLVVDDLEAFAKIESSVIASAAKQSINIDDIEIFPWKDDALCHEVFSQNDGERLSIILELFQCGRPDWMERILFEEKLNRTVQIIMIDYLTAEKYAEDFHCLQSLTRSAKVQKVNFMPGFTQNTGGLVIDDQWKELPVWNKDGPVLIFTYEGDWRSLLEGWLSTTVVPVVECPKGVSKPHSTPRILVAQGRGKKSFMTAVENSGVGAFVEELPYLNQSEWDRIMKSCSALVIRGEESMSRACLSGIPFIWHAYPQSDEYQLVKVKALLERMKPHFDQENFEIIEKAWITINSPERRSNPYSDFFTAVLRLVPGFQDFALSLRKNGDLAYNLMTYIEKLDII